jgi:serine/threonine-protein kinase
MIELPARLGKYELEEYLGGGMSRVYRARDTVIGRTVAVKILTEHACRDEEAKARFLQEARVAGNIAHDNIITVYDFGEDAGKPFMVMEFLRGEDLRTLIKSGRTGDLTNKLRIALQIARALQHIHANRIIHRDIKPENIHITAAGVAKLMDFGIAKAEDTQLTRPGFTLGTPYYMAPEQIRGLPVTPLVDVYAWGVMLFELITGARPIDGDTIERIFHEILVKPLDLAPLHAAGAPQAICDLVARCTAKEAGQRPQDFAAVIAELQAIVKPRSTTSVRTPIPPAAPVIPAPAPEPAAAPPPNWKLLAGVAALGLVMLGGALYLYLHPKAQAPAAAPLAASISTPTGEMALVPAGAFLSGPGKKSVTLPAFYIDRTEVPNSMYERFCQAKGRPLPNGFLRDHPDYPVVNITYLEAQEFARWAGKRLPSPLEWEKAARGADGRPFPWGSAADPKLANVQNNPDRGAPNLAAVDAFPGGAGPYRTLNMIGNVWEIVDELPTPTPAALSQFRKMINATATEPWCALRGGGYNTPLTDTLGWEGIAVPARYSNYDIGFRCAKDAK